MATYSAEIPVTIEDNLHLRPMQVLVEVAARFKSDLTISRGTKQADAKSILSVMMLAAEKGPLRLLAEGADADEAVRTVTDLLQKELNKR